MGFVTSWDALLLFTSLFILCMSLVRRYCVLECAVSVLLLGGGNWFVFNWYCQFTHMVHTDTRYHHTERHNGHVHSV